MNYERLFNDRITICRDGHRKSDKDAFEASKNIIGESIEINKNNNSVNSLYMYQCLNFGSLLNNALRKKHQMSKFLFNLYSDINNIFNKNVEIGKELIVFRGVLEKDLKASGDIIQDNGFNSVSLDPLISEYFGDVILIIKLKSIDKLIYINGHDDLYPDTFECILPSGKRYKIVEQLQIQVVRYGDKTKYKCYLCESLDIIDFSIDINPIFDSDYYNLIFPLMKILKNNENKENQTIIVYEFKKYKNYVKYLYGLGDFNQNDKLYKEIINKKDVDSVIIQSNQIYIGLLTKEISTIYAL